MTFLSMTRQFILASALLILYYPLSIAHEDASSPDFCPNGEIQELSRHTINGDALVKIIEESNGTVNCSIGISHSDNKILDNYVGKVLSNNNVISSLPPSHDAFDRTANQAYTYASCICANLVNQNIKLDIIRPLLLQPNTLTSDDHHKDYRLQHGLSFSCMQCVNPQPSQPCNEPE